MTAKRRTIWLSDEAWAKVHERAAAFSLNPSAYIAKLIEWRQPTPTDGEEVDGGDDRTEAVHP